MWGTGRGSPVAKRRAQPQRKHPRARIHLLQQRPHHHRHRRRRQRIQGHHHHRRHHDRHRRRNQHRHRRRRGRHVVVLPGDTANTDVPRMMDGEAHDRVRRKSGGAAAECGAAGAVRREGEPRGGGASLRPKKGARAAPAIGAMGLRRDGGDPAGEPLAAIRQRATGRRCGPNPAQAVFGKGLLRSNMCASILDGHWRRSPLWRT